MKRTRRVKITTIRRRLLCLQPFVIRTHCPICEYAVETLAAAQAAEVLEVDVNTLNRLIADGRVHAIETVSGSRRVCQDSLFAK